MFRLIRYTLIIISTYVIAINYNSRFFLYATDVISPIVIDMAISNDYIIKTDGSITINENGYINGSVTKHSSINTDVVNINTNYNTIKEIYSTQFGTSGNKLSQINLNDSNLFISNAFYANNLNINNGNLTLNSSTGIDITNITKTGGSTANISINENYSANTTFGTSSNKIDFIKINGAADLTLNNNAYVDNLILSNDSNSSLNLNNGSKVFGNILSNISGNGTININTNYNAGTDTVFGNSTNSIEKVNIANGNSLILGNIAYIDNAELKGNGFLILGAGSAIIGDVYGTGTVYLNRDYQTTSGETDLAGNMYNTSFGNTTNSLDSLVLSNNLTLNNDAYVNKLNLNGATSALTINNSGSITGSIYGTNGTVNLNRNYNTSNILDSNYYNTLFGTNTTSIGTLNLGYASSGYALTLGNIAYINNLVLNNSASSLTLDSNSGVIGTIYGSGTLNINTNYSTTNVNGVLGNNTKIGSSSLSRVAKVNIGKNATDDGLIPEIDITLDLNNNAYVGIMNISNNSVLNINALGNVNGIIVGANNNQGTININKDYNTATSNTIFGVEGNRLKQVNITNNEFTLSNSAYINNFNITSNEVYTGTKRLLTMESNSIFTGSITLDKRDNDMLIGIVLNENYILDLANILSLINTGKNDSASITNGNEAYLNLIDRDTLTNGTVIDIATGKDYSNAGLTYDGIYMDLKLEKSTTDLKLVVNSNRTPTIDDVSQATITSANVIDSWTFNRKSSNENILTANLQAVSNKSEFFHAITNLTPDVSGLNIKVPTQSIISAVANIDKRLNFLRTVKISENTNAFMQNLLNNMPPYHDEYIKKRNMWWELFGGTLHQDTVDNIYGYDATFYGGTVGYDIKVNPSFVFGGSYTFNMVNANDLDYIKSDRDDLKAITNNLDLYMMFYSKWQYLAINVGGGFNMYEQERKINFYEFNRVAKADYNGFSYYGGIEYGFNILLYNSNKQTDSKVKKSEYDTVQRITKKLESYTDGKKNSFIMLTPKISLTYNNIIIDDYTENGGDAANLVIKSKDYNSLDINGGLSLTYNKSISSVTNFQTALNGFVSYGIINNQVELDARYIDDDEVFKVYGIDPPDLTYNVGINFNFNFYEKIDMGLSYNYMFGDGFNGQMIKLSVLYNF